MFASRIKKTVDYLATEQTNFLDHVKWTGPDHPNPNDRDRWIRQLKQKLQNMKDVLKRLPTDQQETWSKIIQSLADMLPKE
jgi:uncharacterized membrane-anchored protein YjiN (DUF445 family)